MLISIRDNYPIIVSIVILISFVFLAFIFLLKKQDPKLNWAIFYATLYVTVTLPFVNFWCVNYGLWQFNHSDTNNIQLPFDLYYLWVFMWSILPVFFLKGKHILLTTALLLWLDILIMPQLAKIEIVTLHENWMIGEFALITTVFLPSYYWAYCSYHDKHKGIRAIFQVIIMGAVFLIGLPFIIQMYGFVTIENVRFNPYLFQLFLILIFPSLIAVHDLVKKGKGTPFPYDPTKNLVQTGVYAYCRNPIQWSFTALFFPLSIFYSTPLFLVGSIFSIAYSFGVSDFQEYDDMQQKYGDEWDTYKNNVPKWRFLWKPKTIPTGEIFFDADCHQCSQISHWLTKANPINLSIKKSIDFPKNNILQVTYVDHNGTEYKSVRAIACAIEHINLAYASLGWFMRFPVINYLLQLIVDTMDFSSREEHCDI